MEKQMGLFGSKSQHAREVDAAFKILGNLYSKTVEGGADAPLVLNFELSDSHFRYYIFCLSTMQKACASRMNNADAVLNELMHDVIIGCVKSDPILFFGDAIEPQAAANIGAEYIKDYLHSWSAYIDIAEGGNTNAATSMVCTMLRSTESTKTPLDDDAQRLWPLATWIEESFEAMANAFTNMV